MTSVLSISSYTLLGSTVTSSFSQIKFPAKSRRPSSSTPKVRSHEADEFAAGHTALSASTSGRRGLLFIATLPCLLPSIQIMDCHGANAIESGTKEYLLIKEEVRKVLSKGKAAGVLRLVFHDAGTFEMDDNTVSWADMIAVAGAEAVAVCGGPKIQVSVGRLDSLEPDPEGKLPEESLDAFGLKKCFLRKGFSTQELVALSGAHTLGSKGFGSPTSFDNSYYKVLLEKPWVSSGGMSSMTGLPSDHALVEDDECLRWIKKYALNENMFFEDFKNAYVKLVNSGVRWKRL
ncbi:putative L-ascorbate peroxidase 6 isoform X3 [Prosopis cineraria]|uniref:putative L-ascorbate peroxidase 6 isoform X3 n=1 Tax=Prosopis cineraria TaxID=364024 RepID=UPI00240FC126|nr:putative L-ascorbate peroxidase 6 isoform X3 [Prosopis cineraria]